MPFDSDFLIWDQRKICEWYLDNDIFSEVRISQVAFPFFANNDLILIFVDITYLFNVLFSNFAYRI